MSILVRTGTIRARSSAMCRVCGKPGVHVGATAIDGGAPLFYHWGCLTQQAPPPLTELLWASTRGDQDGNLAAEAQGAAMGQRDGDCMVDVGGA